MNIQQVLRFLTSASLVKEAGTGLSYAELLRLGHRPTLKKLLSSIRDDRDTCASIAQRSYAHANGFDKIVLCSDPGRWHLRLHIWWPEDTPIQQDVHNHAWNYASLVAAGRLTHTFYAVDTSVAGTHALIEYTPYFSDINPTATPLYRVLGSCSLREKMEVCTPRGTAYWLDHREMHRIGPDPGVMSCSLILQGPFKQRHSLIVSEHKKHLVGAQLTPVPIKNFTRDELADRLQRSLLFL